MFDINGSTKVLGVIGKQIDYTLSPMIHNLSIRKLNKNQVYLPFDVIDEGSVASLLDCFWSLGAVGFNITKPYKELVAGLLKTSDLKAVNTLYRGKTGWLSASTDAFGFISGVEKMGREFAAYDKLLFLGNGGVVTSILEFLGSYVEKSYEVVVLRRDSSRDAFHKSLLHRIRRDHSIVFDELIPKKLSCHIGSSSSRSILIQATSAPLKGNDFNDYCPSLSGFEGSFTDLCYGTTSSLLPYCRSKGLLAQDGIPMLIEQARSAQELWWGTSADFDTLDEAIRKKLVVLGEK